MSIKFINAHKHKICLSFCREINQKSILRYFVSGWYAIQYSKSCELKENDYIHLQCNECNYIYTSDKNIKIYTTKISHNLYFSNIGTNNLYTNKGQKILMDNNCYLENYYLPKNEYNGTIYIGNEKEIKDYIFSEMIKYKRLYDQEKSKNKRLDDDKKEKIKEINENFGIKYNTTNGEGDYDIVLCVDSIKNLNKNGWIIKYNKKEGKSLYEKSKQMKTIVVGVVGNGNKGKSFLLKKLSNYQVPMGFNVKTEGLSIIYGETPKQCLAILDSAGQETPLLSQNKNEKGIDDDKLDINSEQLEFEEYSRDKLITEFYIQQFILWKSNIIILVIGSITLSEQKLYARVKSEILTFQDNNSQSKKLFVVHNLQNFYKTEDVNVYINNTLKKLYNVELEETQMHDPDNKIEGFDKYFLEKDNQNIIHLLFINDYCDCANQYNQNTISYLSKVISAETSRQKFDILDDSREFLFKISEEILENKLSKNDIEINLDKEGTEKLIVKNQNEIQLKKFIVDEMGITKNDGNTAKYSYYIDTHKSKLIVNIELPGGGFINAPKIIPTQGYYSFRFEGEQKGELIPKYKSSDEEKVKNENYEELDLNNMSSIILSKNLRKKHPIHIEFKISYQVMQLKYESVEPKYTVEVTNKGVIIYIFDIILFNKSTIEINNKGKTEV